MKDLLQRIGFSPKENSKGIFVKEYSSFGNYIIEVDFGNKKFNYGKKIKSERTTTQNFSDAENWVVLECVDRLLTKGYKPEDIILEKKFTVGHGASGGWLDILVKKSKKAYLMIECKTWGKEFEKEFSKLQKDGGQLFTYFQQDKNAEYLMLYASEFDGKNINYKNEIIKIEDHYRSASNVVDVYTRWSKLTNQNGIFENWVNAYDFQNKLITKKELVVLSEDDSSFIFHEFLSILRKYSVSDKPNAFNKIFNLLLAKIYDEKKRAGDELDFQWKENIDNPVDFQIRLINLHKEGMLEFLKKEIEGIEEYDFSYKNQEELQKKKKKWLKFNNVFTIKEVIDDESFDDNQMILKEVVELLQKYQIRYPRKQQHLSDFFERLLTTGLKQESGQFFTPPPIARYIIKSIPVREYIKENLNSPTAKLPAIIDYAAGSGHFVTEIMEEYQNIINTLDTDNFYPDAIKEIETWRQNQYSWAAKYIYGIEKDYRLVKVAKVGCYFYGDGLAQIIHGDGLDSFKNSKSYIGQLKQQNSDQDNGKFSFVISNPPYSVSSFKSDIKNKDAETGFELYKYLTDQSSEIECLFIERTKQLLKDNGVAGIILPSSILSNTGLYTKTREIILKYFEIVGITQLGSSTFMATGTNTVVLFLRRKNNNDWENIKNSIDKFFTNFQDITVNGIENIFSKYVSYVWCEIKFSDYISLCQKSPNKIVQEHEIFIEYKKKLKSKNDEDLYKQIIKIEKEKLLYFILAYKQKVVLAKTGEKKTEKQFLGYEFSSRRGYEGIHPMQRSKSIDECTSLFDPNTQENPEKASFYVYKNFLNEDFEIDKSMQKNISVIDLVDMMTFDRVDFEKTINLNASKTVKFDSKFPTVILENLVDFQSGLWKGKKGKLQTTKVLRNTNFRFNNGKLSYDDVAEIEVEINQLTDRKLKIGDIILEKSGGSDTQAIGRVVIFDKNNNEVYSYSNFCSRIRVNKQDQLNPVYLWLLLNNFYNRGGTIPLQNGVRLLNIDLSGYKKIKIPFPPKDIQEKIVKEIEEIEKKDEENKKKIEELKGEIDKIIEKSEISKKQNLGDVLTLEYGNSLTESDRIKGEFPVMGSNGIVGWHNKYLIKGPSIIVGRKGSAGKINWIEKNNFPIDTTFYVNILENNDLKFIYFVLKKLDLEKLGLGAGVPGLNRNDAYNLSFGFPSLPKQQKIVAQIEKIEQKIEILHAEIENSKKQKEEVLGKYL